jgi:hypothetical protein
MRSTTWRKGRTGTHEEEPTSIVFVHVHVVTLFVIVVVLRTPVLSVPVLFDPLGLDSPAPHARLAARHTARPRPSFLRVDRQADLSHQGLSLGQPRGRVDDRVRFALRVAQLIPQRRNGRLARFGMVGRPLAASFRSFEIGPLSRGLDELKEGSVERGAMRGWGDGVLGARS